MQVSCQSIHKGSSQIDSLQEVAAIYQYQIQRKNITLDLDIASPLSDIEVDPGRMTQVLTNIVDNALRHTPEGGRIVLSAKDTNDQVELAIQDSGPGLKAEDIDRIFDRFYRTNSSRQREDWGFRAGVGDRPVHRSGTRRTTLG